jgi:hypothetical protein
MNEPFLILEEMNSNEGGEYTLRSVARDVLRGIMREKRGLGVGATGILATVRNLLGEAAQLKASNSAAQGWWRLQEAALLGVETVYAHVGKGGKGEIVAAFGGGIGGMLDCRFTCCTLSITLGACSCTDSCTARTVP